MSFVRADRLIDLDRDSAFAALADLLASLTEGCEPGPWHGVESGDKAMFGWWLDNPDGDSSFPTPDDVALMVNALPDLLATIARLRKIEEAARAGVEWGWLDWTQAEALANAAKSISAALDAAGFAVVPKETAKRDLEECLRQNGYAIDLVQRNERLQEALDEWERMARQEAKEWNDKHI